MLIRIFAELYSLKRICDIYYYSPEDFERLATIRVRVGSHIKSEGGTLHKVARIVYHPGFDFENLNQDVGVIKVRNSCVENVR